MGGEDSDKAGIPGIGDGGRAGGAGDGTCCGDEGGSSKVVSVTLSTCKVSSDTIGLSNRANECPEGSGTGQGGCGGRVHHCQAEGLGTKGAYDACKKVGVAAECTYGTGMACV